MRKIGLISAFSLYLLFQIPALSQKEAGDSLHTHALDSVIISDTRKVAFDPGIRARFSRTGNEQNVAEILSEKKAVFLRSYGPGLLSSISSRGTEAVHTPIIWNGFSLQNAVNGINDPAIESAPGNYTLSFLPGGQSGLFGSGAVGGTIQLMPDFDQPAGLSASVGAEFGAFGNNREFVRASYKNPTTSATANLKMYSRLNNFPFINRTKAGKPKEKMENAAARGISFNTDFARLLPGGGRFSASVWYQINRRQIPGTMLVPHTGGIQVDKNLRSMAGWEKTWRQKHYLSAKGAFLYDYLFYDDQLLSRPSKMIQYSGLGRLEYEYTPHRNHRFFVGTNYGYRQVYMSEYAEKNRVIHQTTFFSGYKYTLPRSLGELALMATGELWDTKLTPVCPAFSARITPAESWSIRTRINRNFRQPTFNDLYWSPGGNPSLKPETSWSQELGAGWEKSFGSDKKSLRLDVQATAFHQQVFNRIVWVPGPVFWSPENIDRTRAMGAEADIFLTRTRKKWKAEFIIHYTYTRSVRDKARFEGDPAFGKQIPYVPMHMGSAELGITYCRTKLFYRHGYTGKRFTLADNSAYMPHFHTGDAGISQSVTFLGVRFDLWAVCENVANLQYEVLEFRPMPGRFFRGGLSVSFNKHIPRGVFKNKNKNR